MKRLLLILLLFAPAAAFLSISPFAFGRYDALKGLKGVEVVIESLSKGEEITGLTKDRIKTVVELELRKSRIKIFSNKESLKIKGSPFLYINANIQELDNNVGYVSSITLSIREFSSLERNPKIKVYADTWKNGLLLIVPRKGASKSIVNAVRRLLDQFSNDYMKANPKG